MPNPPIEEQLDPLDHSSADPSGSFLAWATQQWARLPVAIRRYGPIFAVFLAVVLLRLPELISRPYPPGGDAAEQIMWAHGWTGTAFAGAPPAIVIPPLYILGVVAPLAALFPIFQAGIVADILVSGLLTFPGYLLMRRLALRRPFALLGAFLLASATAYSSMISWNSGYNLFGIVFLTFAFAFILKSLQTGDHQAMVLAGVFVGLTGAANLLSLFIAAVILGALFLSLLFFRARRELLRRHLRIVAYSFLAVLPVAPIYYYAFVGSYNTVGSHLAVSLPAAALLSVTVPWGTLSTTFHLLVVWLDVALGSLGIILLAIRRERRLAAAFLLTVLLASFAASIADPGNITRGYYYIPLALVPAIAWCLQGLYDRVSLLPWLRRGKYPTDPLPFALPRPRRSRWRVSRMTRSVSPTPRLTVTSVLTILVILGFAGANAQVSLSTFVTSDKFYTPMTPGGLQALHWLHDHVPVGSAVFSSSEYISKWIWAYDNRQALYPTNLNLEVTRISYDQVQTGDLIGMGDYDVGNSLINVGANAPGMDGVPTVYLSTPGYWNMLFNTLANETSLTVAALGASAQRNVTLDQSTPGPVQLSANATTSVLVQSFTWPTGSGGPVTLLETISVANGTVSIHWDSGTSGTEVRGLAIRFYLPPPADDSRGYRHAYVPLGCQPTNITDLLRFGSHTFSATLSGPTSTICQWTGADGWTRLNFTGGSNLSIAVSGYPANYPSAPYAVDSFLLLQQNRIHYILAELGDTPPGLGLIIYERFLSLPPRLGYSAVPCFDSGGYAIIGLGSC